MHFYLLSFILPAVGGLSAIKFRRFRSVLLWDFGTIDSVEMTDDKRQMKTEKSKNELEYKTTLNDPQKNIFLFFFFCFFVFFSAIFFQTFSRFICLCIFLSVYCLPFVPLMCVFSLDLLLMFVDDVVYVHLSRPKMIFLFLFSFLLRGSSSLDVRMFSLSMALSMIVV